ncbi:MAG: acyltransferase, partial [Oscillospiraceae bacterium]
RGLYYYTLGHLIRLFHYDRRYCTGRHFSGRLNGLCSIGWRWVVADYRACKKQQVNMDIPWPVSSRIMVSGPQNITFHPDDLNNFQGVGNYFQAVGKITIGKGTYIAANVGIITANHNMDNLDEHTPPKAVIIGERCWIGMNSVILPGVTLGNHTIVGAGSIVTKSFPTGNCVIVGNPAKLIRVLDQNGGGEDEPLS